MDLSLGFLWGWTHSYSSPHSLRMHILALCPSSKILFNELVQFIDVIGIYLLKLEVSSFGVK